MGFEPMMPLDMSDFKSNALSHSAIRPILMVFRYSKRFMKSNLSQEVATTDIYPYNF